MLRGLTSFGMRVAKPKPEMPETQRCREEIHKASRTLLNPGFRVEGLWVQGFRV